jgi:hypothetical protein
MCNVYLLCHSYEYGAEKEHTEIKILGVYSSSEKALKAIEKYKILPGFNEYPVECFSIDEYVCDTSHWTEGFCEI